ncbi:hypothetical protein GCM10028807_57630 [Spirosoma daeguense]
MKTIILLLISSTLALAQTNTSGLVAEPSGLQVAIEIPIAPDSTINVPHLRRSQLVSMTFENDLHILITQQINYYTPDGVLMSTAIEADSTLSVEGKEFMKRRFASFIVGPKSTRGSLVDVATKKVLVGDPLPGHTYVPELLTYQQMTRSDLAAMGVAGAGSETRPLQLVYKFTMLGMQQILHRVGLL